MDKGLEENGIALKKIVPRPDSANSHANPIFSMETESDTGPPPYIGPSGSRQQSGNGEGRGGQEVERDFITQAVSPSNISINGDIQKLDSLLAVEHGNVETRKRHKSEGAVPTSPPSKSFLDPNNRKNSMYESKSTISGVKFDDSFIGKLPSCIPKFIPSREADLISSFSCFIAEKMVLSWHFNDWRHCNWTSFLCNTSLDCLPYIHDCSDATLTKSLLMTG